MFVNVEEQKLFNLIACQFDLQFLNTAPVAVGPNLFPTPNPTCVRVGLVNIQVSEIQFL